MQRHFPTGIFCSRFTASVLFFVCLSFTSQLLGQAPKARQQQQVTIDGIHFVIPEGTKLEKVGDQPFIRWPVAADWDTDGSLVVLESNWNRESVQQQLESKPHRIVRLRDSNGDGRFDKRKVIADKLSFSAGVLVYQDSIFVSSPPTIFKLTDPNGDGFFETHQVWYDGGTLTYCANDLHGPFLGLDGWLYWTKGAFAEQQYETLLGRNIVSSAAHLLRRHPAGGPVDILMSGGMDNPVDVAFLPNGERIFCSTFMHHPGDGLRDGLGHAVYGSLFGKPHGPVDGHWRTGPLFNPIEELGPAAPAAVMAASPRCLTHQLAILADTPETIEQGASDLPMLISSQFNFQSLVAHQLLYQGGSFTTIAEELIKADRVDFHPVDCLEEPDGSLLILDTGGWYDLCCPSSGTPGQVAPGGIYRLSLLNPPNKNSAAQNRAVENKENSLANELSEFWTLARTLVKDPEDQTVKASVIAALRHPSELKRQAALHVISLYRWEEARPSLLNMLDTAVREVGQAKERASFHTLRLAAECLGRMGGANDETIESLLRVLEQQSWERTADHAVVYALIEIGQQGHHAKLRESLAGDAPRRQWAAMIVLEQLKQLSPADGPRLLDLAQSSNEAVRSQAIATLKSQAHLADATITDLESLWQADKEASFELLKTILPSWMGQAAAHKFVANALQTWTRLSDAQKEVVVRAVNSLRGTELPHSWREPLGVVLADGGESARNLARAFDGVSWKLPADQLLLESIIKLADDPAVELDQKLALLGLLPSQTAGVPETLVDQVLRGTIDEDAGLASRCAGVLGNLRLSDEQAKRLVESLQSMNSVQLQNAVLAILAVNNPLLDNQILETIPSLPVARTLTPGPIEAAVSKRSEAARQAFADLFNKLLAPPDDIRAAVNSFLEKLPPGNPTEGYQVFRGPQASCAACHRVGYVGGKIGPELTRIGRSRSKYDLAEAILYPSARLEQSYQSTRVLTEDGRVINGLLASISDSHIELITGPEKTEIVPLNELERREPSPLSIMPTGLDSVLTAQQFADLLAFLQETR